MLSFMFGMIRRSLLLLCGLIALGGLISVQPVLALTVSPIIVDEALEPGRTLTGKIRLINETKANQTYFSSVQNFIAEGEDGQQTFLPEANQAGLAAWLKPANSSVTIKPGEMMDFGWTLYVPLNAEPGGHYAAMFFSSLPPSAEGGAVGIGSKIGVLFLVNVHGNIREEAVVESFRVFDGEYATRERQTVWLSHLPANFELRIRNQGSVHVHPKGTISVQNALFQKSTQIAVNPADSRILPNSVRRIRSVWGPMNLAQEETFIQSLKNEWMGFALGKYVATADVYYGSTNQNMISQVTFWVFPWRLSLIGLILLALLVCVFKAYNRMVIFSALGRKK